MFEALNFKTRVFWLLLYLMQIAGNGFECGSWNTNTAALLENCQKSHYLGQNWVLRRLPIFLCNYFLVPPFKTFMPCPYTGPKMFSARPQDQKLNCIYCQSKVFCDGTKTEFTK
jgi:hypothetical protein